MPEPKGPRSIVCIKQVPKAQELQVDPVTNTLKRVGVPSEINPPDRNALEMALQIKDKHGGEVFVVTMGPPVFTAALEEALAMGCDRAFLLTDRLLGGSDTVPTAYALSEVILKIGGYDLVFCGEETTDASTGHVGPGIAGHLDCAQITYCSEAELLGDRVRARRAVEDGFETWECPLPCVITVNFLSSQPRPESLTGKIRVKRGGLITTWSCADVGIDPNKVGIRNSPTIVAKVDTVVLPDRKAKIFRGDPKEAVANLLDAMVADGVIAP
ncbi:MAG: electron transfer flavoprotein subunit beta/FixA family protein [Euryarchaeota archaeon]|nr:electron transfer flavoprotein subunit beta/FixA family protein [Euryarchaeota archaeon]